MKTLFLANGPIEWGSSRMRAWWVAPHMQDTFVVHAKEMIDSHQILEADTYIFQKVFNEGLFKKLKDDGKRVFWDVCDPAWWFNPKECAEAVRLADGIVCCNQALADDLRAWIDNLVWDSHVKLYVIPDRLDFTHFEKKRQHKEVNPVRLIWYGLSVNRVALAGTWQNLERLWANNYNFELTIFDDRPDKSILDGYSFPVFHIQWNLNLENEVLAGQDIALLPPYPGPWATVKSNNRDITAAACNLPVIRGFDYRGLCDHISWPKLREEKVVKDISAYDVKLSAQEWERILDG